VNREIHMVCHAESREDFARRVNDDEVLACAKDAAIIERSFVKKVDGIRLNGAGVDGRFVAGQAEDIPPIGEQALAGLVLGGP